MWHTLSNVKRVDIAGFPMTEPLPGPIAIDRPSPRKTTPERAGLKNPFLNAVKAAIIGTDLAGAITYWNPFAEELYGWKAEEVVGRNVMDITVSSENEERAREHMATVAGGGSW